MSEHDTVRPLRWRGDALELLDQRRLPAEEIWLTLGNATEVAAAIRDMAVRGAPAIGIAAAYGLALAARAGEDPAAAADRLVAARPTAVNLAWAVARMRRAAAAGADADGLAREAEAIHAADLAANQRIGAHGAALLAGAGAVITHCNTGALATGGHGTALGVIRTAWSRERLDEVLVGETRPWLQGARLTAWELARERIPARVMCDSAAAAAMGRGDVQAVVVGADRVAANGDVANKIGTRGLAILAQYHGIPFVVAAPWSTVDTAVADGDAIPIEERPGTEVLDWADRRVAPEGTRAWNPVFDITPAGLVTALVTEHGVLRQPDRAGIAGIAAEAVDSAASAS